MIGAMEGSDGTPLTVEGVKFVRDRPYAHMHSERDPRTQNGTPFITEILGQHELMQGPCTDHNVVVLWLI